MCIVEFHCFSSLCRRNRIYTSNQSNFCDLLKEKERKKGRKEGRKENRKKERKKERKEGRKKERKKE